jgi:hypothetical protein
MIELKTRKFRTLCGSELYLIYRTNTLESRSRLPLVLGGGKDATYVVYWSVAVYIAGQPIELIGQRVYEDD